jgi:hypothetical protein
LTVTPKRPEATCLIEERRSSRKRAGSSPPSPVFERPPSRFMPVASVSWASGESAPSDIPPDLKRFTISVAGSTSSSGICSAASLKRRRPRSEVFGTATSFTYVAKRSYASPPFSSRAACWSVAIVSGFQPWYSPSRRHA